MFTWFWLPFRRPTINNLGKCFIFIFLNNYLLNKYFISLLNLELLQLFNSQTLESTLIEDSFTLTAISLALFPQVSFKLYQKYYLY